MHVPRLESTVGISKIHEPLSMESTRAPPVPHRDSFGLAGCLYVIGEAFAFAFFWFGHDAEL